jgi:hypothetical protein
MPTKMANHNAKAERSGKRLAPPHNATSAHPA